METKRKKVSDKKYRRARRAAEPPVADAGRLPVCLAPPESHCPVPRAQLSSRPPFCKDKSLEPRVRVVVVAIS
jgi:hypothetical protein